MPQGFCAVKQNRLPAGAGIGELRVERAVRRVLREDGAAGEGGEYALTKPYAAGGVGSFGQPAFEIERAPVIGHVPRVCGEDGDVQIPGGGNEP